MNIKGNKKDLLNYNLPISHVVGTNGRSSSDSFAEVRVDRGTGNGFQTHQLPGCGHVEALGEVVQEGDGHDHGQENRRGQTNNHNGSQNLANSKIAM